MAIGGSFSADTFKTNRPIPLWQQLQYDTYYDTQNPFARGISGVQGVKSNPFVAGIRGVQSPKAMGIVNPRQSRYDLGVQAPVATLGKLSAPSVNFLGSSGPQLNFGGRNYGSQAIDRGELARLGQTGDLLNRNREALASTTARVQRHSSRNRQSAPGIRSKQGRHQPGDQPEQAIPGMNPQQQFAINQNLRAWQGPQAPQVPPMSPTEQLAVNRNLGAWQTEYPSSNVKNPADPLEAANQGIGQLRRKMGYTGTPSTPTPPSDTEPVTSEQRWAKARELQAGREAAVESRGGRVRQPGAVPSTRGSAVPTQPGPRPGAVGTVPIAPVGVAGTQADRLAAEGVATPQTTTKKRKKA